MTSTETSHLHYPLSIFYERDGRELPSAERLRPRDVPEPHRRLLVHREDMTPTLSGYFGEPVRLRVLNVVHEPDFYAREVVLFLASSGRAVEYGAIRIFLERFPPGAAKSIVEARQPLGALLAGIPHFHESPRYFLRVRANGPVRKVFDLPSNGLLYARRNTITNDLNEPLADVLEMLPPLEE